MLILAFDTTSEHGGVALHRDFVSLGSAANERGANYSVTLFQTVERLLSEARLALREVDLFAVANGPGSFTGIRVGVAAAQGWAQATRRPVRGVSVLEAMVEQARPAADWAVPILDARRGEFYLSLFRRNVFDRAPAPHKGRATADDVTAWGRLSVLEAEDSARRPEARSPEPGFLLHHDSARPFLERLAVGQRAGETVCCLAREQDSAAQALRAVLPEAFGWQNVPGPLMGAIARLALMAHRGGGAQSPAQLDALYLRRSDAEMHWKES